MNLVLMLINNIVSLSEKVALVGQEVKHSLIAAEDLVKFAHQRRNWKVAN